MTRYPKRLSQKSQPYGFAGVVLVYLSRFLLDSSSSGKSAGEYPYPVAFTAGFTSSIAQYVLFFSPPSW